MGAAFPKGWPRSGYMKANAAGRDAIRKKFGMRPLSISAYAWAKAQKKRIIEKPAATAKAKRISRAHPDGRWLRTTEGAAQFIRDWNSVPNGQAFMDKFTLDKPGWHACFGRAKTIRERLKKMGVTQVTIKEHKIEGMRLQYDWTVLMKVAEETAA